MRSGGGIDRSRSRARAHAPSSGNAADAPPEAPRLAPDPAQTHSHNTKHTTQHTTQQNADGKKVAVDAEHADGGERVIWRPNDFPYNFEPGMRHWLLWAAGELPRARILELIGAKFPEADWDALTFTNPPVLQSVLTVWHCHVIVRPKQRRD